MTRKFALISKEDLKKKVEKLADDNGEFSIYHLIGHLGNDIKVDLDLENQGIGEEGDKVYGIQTLANGLTYWMMWAGGDGGPRNAFIVYWDGKRIRGYIPAEGNCWNTDTNTVYGYGEYTEDLKNIKKRFPDYPDTEESQEYKYIEIDWFDICETQLVEDIVAHFIPREKLSPKSLQQRIEELKFYCPCNESGELFQHACSMCYYMSRAGEDKRAEILYKWAKGYAESSIEWSGWTGSSIEELNAKKDYAFGKWEGF